MKTNTITASVLAGTIVFCLTACSKSKVPPPAVAEKTEPPKPQKQAQPIYPPLDQEALNLAEKAFTNAWLKVGDSWITLHRYSYPTFQEKDLSEFIQISVAHHEIVPVALSQANILNGFQWDGQVKFSSDAHRDYGMNQPQDRRWSIWKNGSPGDSIMHYTLSKKNGQWQQPANAELLIKPTEEQIKSILPAQ